MKASKAAISVCSDLEDKHAFRFLRDRPVDERPLTDPGPDGPDLVVFQAGQGLGFADTAAELPPRLWASAQAGRGKVVFDASTEGEAHDPHRSEVMHEMLRRVGVPLEQGVYITQDRQYASDYADFLQRTGVPRGMKIVVHDYWIRRVLSEFEQTGPEVLEARLQGFRQRRPHRERRFLSLNFTPRPARLMFLTRLMREGLWDQGYVSFGGFDQMKRRKGRSLDMIKVDFLELPGFQERAATLEPYLDELARRGRILIGDVPSQRPYQEILRPITLAEYDESWFSVVTETEMLDRPSRITEKALKPLLNLHPFVLFGNPGSLQMIKDLGFVTFQGMVDESYDEELEPPRRFNQAFRQVRRLCRLDEDQLARMSDALTERIEFNAKWGLTKLPRKYATKLDDALLTEVLAPA